MLETESVKKEIVASGKYIIKWADQLAMLFNGDKSLTIELIFEDGKEPVMKVGHFVVMNTSKDDE